MYRYNVVIDARHGLKAPDREMLAFLSKYGNVAYQVVLNKTDLVKPADLARRAFLIREELRWGAVYTLHAGITRSA